MCRLALTHPDWSPAVHSEFPASFREAVKVLVAAAVGRSAASQQQAEQQVATQSWLLSLDVTRTIIAAAAYPLSAWQPLEAAQAT